MVRTLVLIAAVVGIASGCMMPPYKLTKGFSSTYRKHLLDHERYETGQPQPEAPMFSGSRRLFYKQPSQQDLMDSMNSDQDRRGLNNLVR